MRLSGKPESVQNCSLNPSTDSFQVSCNPGFNGGLPQHFTLAVYKIKDETPMEPVLAANMSSTLPSFTVSGQLNCINQTVSMS